MRKIHGNNMVCCYIVCLVNQSKYFERRNGKFCSVSADIYYIYVSP